MVAVILISYIAEQLLFFLIAMVGVTLAVINAFLLAIMYFVGVRL